MCYCGTGCTITTWGDCKSSNLLWLLVYNQTLWGTGPIFNPNKISVWEMSLKYAITQILLQMISSHSSPVTVSTKATTPTKVIASTKGTVLTVDTCWAVSSTTTWQTPPRSLSRCPLRGIIHSDCPSCQILCTKPTIYQRSKMVKTHVKACCALVLWHHGFTN